ncbi:hypothetical protein L2E82_09360 [Cichorium intybus]|uniref:Uncharacterized protein n=1 Tax=Cichorium intybus TaxID=13427 RepID=A0ACB9G809_CICIN|nr:hypothetical protein L2E82_09360 [Cichorium intybus]
MCKCRSHGTFPLFGLQSSHLNICYYHQDPHRRPLRPGSRPRFCSDRRALLLIGAWHLPRRPGVGLALKRHPFSGLVDSAGMLTLEPFSEDQGRSAVHPARGIPPISFLAPCGFTHPLTRTHVRLLGPCFKTGRMGCPQAGAGSTQGCIPKQPDSQTAPRGATGSGQDGALTLSGAPFQGTWARSAAEDASPDYNSDSQAARFSSWADPGSLAVTKGILTNLRPDAMCPDKECMVGGDAMRDAQAGVALGATCVQKLDGSRDSAIHTKYRILLRSSSMREPRYPLPRVVCDSKEATTNMHTANGTKLDGSFSFVVFLGTYRAGVCYCAGLKSMAPQMGQPQT